ncbi:MAG: hypothetical protein CYPHOPRED_002539 [Cyphobasidiales sp. Tagirdzhanova-0007]|nr:MAG: hypothetical protein CYPHOPRED_002539 [Cyphobasidiales sp. Tagirdzhanova-0007]
MHIYDLPDDLLCEIISYFVAPDAQPREGYNPEPAELTSDLDTLLALCLTSKRFLGFSQKRFFRNVALSSYSAHANGLRGATLKKRLICLEAANGHLLRSVISLRLQFNLRHEDKLLCRALKVCECLQFVSIVFGHGCGCTSVFYSVDQIVRALQCLSRLETLELDLTQMRTTTHQYFRTSLLLVDLPILLSLRIIGLGRISYDFRHQAGFLPSLLHFRLYDLSLSEQTMRSWIEHVGTSGMLQALALDNIRQEDTFQPLYMFDCIPEGQKASLRELEISVVCPAGRNRDWAALQSLSCLTHLTLRGALPEMPSLDLLPASLVSFRCHIFFIEHIIEMFSALSDPCRLPNLHILELLNIKACGLISENFDRKQREVKWRETTESLSNALEPLQTNRAIRVLPLTCQSILRDRIGAYINPRINPFGIQDEGVPGAIPDFLEAAAMVDAVEETTDLPCASKEQL